MKRLIALLLAALVCMSAVPALALEYTAPDYGLTFTLPEGDWIRLTGEEMDSRQDLIEGEDGLSKGRPVEMTADGTIVTCFPPDGGTELQVTAVENEFSKDAFHLNRVPKDYKDDFIKGLSDGSAQDLMGYTYYKSKYYQHPQTEWIHYEMNWFLDDWDVPMRKYYTVVNGVNVSVNLFAWDGEVSEEDEALIERTVDSMRWDELLTPTEEFRGYSGVSFLDGLGMILGTFAVCGVLFAAYNYADWKPVVVDFAKKILGKK